MNNLSSKFLKRFTNGELTLIIQKCKYIIDKRKTKRIDENTIVFNIKESDIVQRGIVRQRSKR